MAILTAEYLVPARFRDHYDLYDEMSLNAFHFFIAKRISDELDRKYGWRATMYIIPQHEIWEEDFGLIADCDFEELPDGSLLVTFSREPYPPWGMLREEDYLWYPDGSLLPLFDQARERFYRENTV